MVNLFQLPCRYSSCRSLFAAPLLYFLHLLFASLVEKSLDKRMDQFFHDWWLDMGAVFLTFAVYTLPDGRLAIDSYNHIARTMGVQMETFISRQKEKIDELKRLLMNYAKEVRQMVSINQQTANTESAKDPEVRLLNLGYPLMPTTIVFNDEVKGDLDKILQSYLECHYSMCNSISMNISFHSPIHRIGCGLKL